MFSLYRRYSLTLGFCKLKPNVQSAVFQVVLVFIYDNRILLARMPENNIL